MTSPATAEKSGSNPVVEQNIRALVQRRREEDHGRSTEDRVADVITGFTGSMAFVYVHLFIYAVWILANSGMFPWPRFDPSFVILAMTASVEAIFLSTFVLISQNRMAVVADRRADLDLQISLLAEHEITQLIKLVSAIAGRLDLPEARDPALDVSRHDVLPEKVLDSLEREK